MAHDPHYAIDFGGDDDEMDGDGWLAETTTPELLLSSMSLCCNRGIFVEFGKDWNPGVFCEWRKAWIGAD